jgi:hypothetical protein
VSDTRGFCEKIVNDVGDRCESVDSADLLIHALRAKQVAYDGAGVGHTQSDV